MKELVFPFDSKAIIRNKRQLEKQLLSDGTVRIKKKIAVLSGSTCDHVISMLRLFLLNYGIDACFYKSQYNKYYEDAVFGSPELDNFKPDIVYVYTTSRNLTLMPDDTAVTEETADMLLEDQFSHFRQVWENVKSRFNCPVIQNNFELPLVRRTGNYDGWGVSGRSAFIERMNVMLSDYARHHSDFYINDINYLSSAIGLEKWHDPEAWYIYKYAMSPSVIPDLAYSCASIIKAIYGRNHKVIDLDLDNTLWGGVIGDDGKDGIVIGPETAVGQSHSEFQTFIRGYKNYGVLLAVCSKNDEDNAIAGLEHPSCVLRPEDFVSIKANWENKDRNVLESAQELNLMPDSFVFIDDNPAECAMMEAQIPQVQTVHLSSVGDAMYTLSRGGFFEVTSVSGDDVNRTEMYTANAKRAAQEKCFESYKDYLLSLKMYAKITDFLPVYRQRITQLTNKSNQFNLTTKRFTESEIEEVSNSPDRIRLCGRLTDKFGDNGIVSVIIARCEGETAHIELWLMSCRVLKRDMELAMLDELVKKCHERGIRQLTGYYYKTMKNNMVSGLYQSLGFENISMQKNGDSVWKLSLENYKNKNEVIKEDKRSYDV